MLFSGGKLMTLQFPLQVKKKNKCLSGELDVAAAVKSLFSFLLMCVPKLTLRLIVTCVTVSLATTAASSQGGREPI